MKKGVAWATYVGKLALAQHDDKHKPDHDLPPKQRGTTRHQKFRQPTVPTEAKVLRRFTWASRSLGTVEFTEDLHDEEDCIPSQPTTLAQQCIAKWREAEVTDDPAETRVRRYMAAFNCRGRCDGDGRRVYPNTQLGKHFGHEDLDLLKPQDALGHVIMVAGMPPEQFFWCRICGAHTARRARNLAKVCSRRMRNPRVTKLLELGKHPYESGNPLLATMPRRLTIRDVGGTCYSFQGDSDGSITGNERTMPRVIRPLDTVTSDKCIPLVECFSEEEDPFGFGVGLDAP